MTEHTFSTTLDITREFFDGLSSYKRAEEIINQLKSAGKLSLGILRSYLAKADLLPIEWQKLLTELLQSISKNKHEIIPLLPSLMPLITSSSPILRNTIIEIIQNLGEEALITEHFCYGFLRNPSEEVKLAGAKMLLHLSKFKNSTFCHNLTSLQDQYKNHPEIYTILAEAEKLCLNNNPSCSLQQKPHTINKPIFLDLSGKNILLVDDDPQIRNLLNTILKRCNAIITEAHSGQEAVDIINAVYGSSGKYDLLITDLMMPGINGMNLIQHLRDNFSNDKTPIIIMTAVKDKNIALTAMNKYQISSYLIKPVPISKFCNSLNEIFQTKKIQAVLS